MFFSILRTIGYVIGGLVVVAIITLVGLNEMRGTPPSDVVQKNTLAFAYLQKNRDSYGQCSRSVNYSDSMINDVMFDDPRYGSSQASNAHLQQIANDFKAKVKQECQETITNYEQNYTTYQETEAQIVKDTQSQLSKILGNQPQPDPVKLSYYQPATVRVTTGSAFSDYTFSRSDIEQYFAKH